MTVNLCEDVRLYHYRYKNKGGKFDGTCRAYCAYTTTENFNNNYTMVKFKCTSYAAVRYIFSIYKDSNEMYNCYIDTNGKINVNVGADTCTVNFVIDTDKIYNLAILPAIAVSGNDYCYISIFDEYMNFIYKETFSFGASGTFVENAGINIGSYWTAPRLPFVGYIYDLSFGCDTRSGYSQTGGNKIRFVFIEGYNSEDKDTIAEFTADYSAAIFSRPTDFWSSKTRICDYATNVDTINTACDKYKCRGASTWNLRVDSSYSIADGDTIAVEYKKSGSYYTTYLFRVQKVVPYNNQINEIILTDVWQELENYYTDKMFSYYGGSFSDDADFNQMIYWQNYIPFVYGTDGYQTTDYDLLEANFAIATDSSKWLTIEYIYKRFYYTLDLDAILGDSGFTNDYTSIYDSIDSRYLVIPLIHLCKLGGGDYTSNVIKNAVNYYNLDCFTLFKYLLIITRRRWYYLRGGFEMGNVSDMATNDAIANNYNFKTSSGRYLFQKLYNEVKVTDGIASATHTYCNDIYNGNLYKKNTLTLPDNLILYKRDSAAITTTNIMAASVEDLALQLDSEIFAEYYQFTVKTVLEADQSENFYMDKKEDLINFTQDVRVEVII